MPILTDWKIEISVDDVLRKQGAKPEIIKSRSPHLYDIAEQARDDSKNLLDPFVMFDIQKITAFSGNKLTLESGVVFEGQIVEKHLGNAKHLLLAACTISDKLEKKVSESFKEDPAYALALDAAGIASISNLSKSAKDYFKSSVIPKDTSITMALNPGMVGWPIEEGQPPIFAVLGNISRKVTLTHTNLMVPAKSVSFIFGIGDEVNPHGSHCDECERRFTCFNSDYYNDGH
jgi:hypothetical protein